MSPSVQSLVLTMLKKTFCVGNIIEYALYIIFVVGYISRHMSQFNYYCNINIEEHKLISCMVLNI
jgi:hypothetical protein